MRLGTLSPGGNPGGITTGGDGDTPLPGDDDGGATIEDGIVPLALMHTRGELMNFLHIRAGSPAAAPAIFADVPADHEFALGHRLGPAQRHRHRLRGRSL